MDICTNIYINSPTSAGSLAMCSKLVEACCNDVECVVCGVGCMVCGVLQCVAM